MEVTVNENFLIMHYSLQFKVSVCSFFDPQNRKAFLESGLHLHIHLEGVSFRPLADMVVVWNDPYLHNFKSNTSFDNFFFLLLISSFYSFLLISDGLKSSSR